MEQYEHYKTVNEGDSALIDGELMKGMYDACVEEYAKKLLAENKRLTSTDDKGNATVLVGGDEPVEAVAKAATQKLYNYEDAEENGTLIKLPPCKVGDTVYAVIDKMISFAPDVYKSTVQRFIITKCGIMVCVKFKHNNLTHGDIAIPVSQIFFTREEAEKALKERENE